jgi:hypothetical protein
MDQDYQWCIKPTTPIVHWQHYKEFCHSGVAFESRLGEYNVPNRTLASYMEVRRRRIYAIPAGNMHSALHEMHHDVGIHSIQFLQCDVQWNSDTLNPKPDSRSYGHHFFLAHVKSRELNSASSISQGTSKETGEPILVRGFWADVINSPYFAFGVETHSKDRPRLFKVASGQ